MVAKRKETDSVTGLIARLNAKYSSQTVPTDLTRLPQQNPSLLHRPICVYFGIKYPILLAGMSGVAMHNLFRDGFLCGHSHVSPCRARSPRACTTTA